VSTEGDSFFSVFTSATGAVTAAIRAQQEVATAAWPDDVLVRVRMGLHTGEAGLVGDEYVSLEVNRTARIAAAAHGGQVLVSDPTRCLVERVMPAEAELRELGRHRLKDLADPELLHQLVIEGLEQDFPPPRTLDARTTCRRRSHGSSAAQTKLRVSASSSTEPPRHPHGHRRDREDTARTCGCGRGSRRLPRWRAREREDQGSPRRYVTQSPWCASVRSVRRSAGRTGAATRAPPRASRGRSAP
jgi:hypothetical protein